VNISKSCTKSSTDYVLIPIDHGYALPHWKHLEDINHEWMFWPQVKEPTNKECLEYIKSLDAEADAALLCMALPSIPEESLFSLFIGTTLLQHCVLNRKMLLYDIASLLLRPTIDYPSPLEKIIAKTEMNWQQQFEVGNQQSQETEQTLLFPSPSVFPHLFLRIFVKFLDEYLDLKNV